MSQLKQRIPAVDGWFSTGDDGPHLVGTRCTKCGTVFFPRQSGFCRNPHCDGSDLSEVGLSRKGTVWSYTNNCYPPPLPYVSPDPFVPYTIVAVELAREQLVVLGQLATGLTVDDVRVGTEVELCLEPLFEDDAHIYMVWKWRPTGEGSGLVEGGHHVE